MLATSEVQRGVDLAAAPLRVRGVDLAAAPLRVRGVDLAGTPLRRRGVALAAVWTKIDTTSLIWLNVEISRGVLRER